MNDISGELGPHPLAVALVVHLRSSGGSRVLEVGTGSGRNRRALQAAGLEVESYETPPQDVGSFDAAISTHALLHGTRASVAESARAIAQILKHGAPFFATFASVRDRRFGNGIRIDEHSYAPDSGEERGVAHAYFDEPSLREMLEDRFLIESLEERAVEEIVGRWAHALPPKGSVHFFLVSRKRGIDA